jgi:hypothetical protein
MQYTYIEKAMVKISRERNGPELLEHIASSLSKKVKTQVTAINNALNFTLPFYRVRPIDLDGTIELRRMALLIAKTIGTRRPVGSRLDPESWDPAILQQYIDDQKTQAGSAIPSGGGGAYLAGSFWAYATEEERLFALASRAEAIELCTYGLVAANHAIHGPTANPIRGAMTDTYFGMLRMWFGDTPGVAEHVKKKLRRTLAGLQSTYLALRYAGKNVKAASELREKGCSSSGAIGAVVTKKGWGDAKSETDPNGIRLCLDFFDPASTKLALEQQIAAIDPTENSTEAMQISRGGALLHEATHLFAGTRDEYLKDEVYLKLGHQPPKTGEGRSQGYGPITCFTLAKVDPANAINNADSYRIFCEVAKHHRQHASQPA